MEWVPVVFVSFKLVVFVTGMFFAIKWHYDQDERTDKGALVRTVGKAAAIFTVALLVLLFATFSIANMLHMDLAGL